MKRLSYRARGRGTPKADAIKDPPRAPMPLYISTSNHTMYTPSYAMRRRRGRGRQEVVQHPPVDELMIDIFINGGRKTKSMGSLRPNIDGSWRCNHPRHLSFFYLCFAYSAGVLSLPYIYLAFYILLSLFTNLMKRNPSPKPPPLLTRESCTVSAKKSDKTKKNPFIDRLNNHLCTPLSATPFVNGCQPSVCFFGFLSALFLL